MGSPLSSLRHACCAARMCLSEMVWGWVGSHSHLANTASSCMWPITWASSAPSARTAGEARTWGGQLSSAGVSAGGKPIFADPWPCWGYF